MEPLNEFHGGARKQLEGAGSMFKQMFDTIDEVTHAAKGEASSATLRGRCQRPTFLLFSRAWRRWEQDQGRSEHGGK
jgi:hypothetical protein